MLDKLVILNAKVVSDKISHKNDNVTELSLTVLWCIFIQSGTIFGTCSGAFGTSRERSGCWAIANPFPPFDQFKFGTLFFSVLVVDTRGGEQSLSKFMHLTGQQS